MIRGDDAYRSGDYATAASYYVKVSEVDEAYRDAGAKYWLSKALAAKAKGEAAAQREAKGKLRGLTVPGSLKADLAGLGPNVGDVRTNSKDGQEYVYIPGGTFQMGSVQGDPDDRGGTKPRHAVTISKDFWMGRTEVTVGAYKRFCSATGRAMRQPPSFNANWQSEDHPMVNVTWEDARAYCEWAGGRLPTEAEWEYAARAGTETVYYWGNTLDGAYAWYVENSDKQTHPVGKRRANGWGLYDMVGNVWEWCSDWCEESYYASSPAIDPTGPFNGRRRALRGGSYLESTNLYLSARGRLPAAAPLENTGFRCLRTAAPLSNPMGQSEASLPPPTMMKPLEASSVLGKYISESDPSDYMELKRDGILAVRHQGRSLRGKYTFRGDTIDLDATWIKAGYSEASVYSETTIYWNGTVWEKQTGR